MASLMRRFNARSASFFDLPSVSSGIPPKRGGIIYEEW
jgi:hypothetical protein